MSLRLSPANQAAYSARQQAIEAQKQAAISSGDKAGARWARQVQSQLYNEFAALQLPPEPPSPWEVERSLTLAQRVDRVEALLCLIVRANSAEEWQECINTARARLSEVATW